MAVAVRVRVLRPLPASGGGYNDRGGYGDRGSSYGGRSGSSYGDRGGSGGGNFGGQRRPMGPGRGPGGNSAPGGTGQRREVVMDSDLQIAAGKLEVLMPFSDRLMMGLHKQHFKGGANPTHTIYGSYPYFVYRGSGFAPLFLFNIFFYKERFLCQQRRS